MFINKEMDRCGAYSEILLGHKKEWNNASCSNVDAVEDGHTELSQKEKDGYHTTSPTRRL